MDLFHWRSCTTGAASASDFITRVTQCTFTSAPVNTPLSDFRLLLLTSVVYLLSISILYSRYAKRPPKFGQSRAFVLIAACHNLFLSLSSLAMNLGISYAAYLVSKDTGISSTICSPYDTEVPFVVQRWFYIFYLSKYYELLDTFLLILRGRPLTVLHAWHHTSVVYEIWAWLESGMVLGVYGMWFNTFVHVIMYAYYASVLLKIRFPMKKAITTIQIIQFLTGFASLIPYLWLHLRGEGCRGRVGLTVSALCNASYLLLFLRFFKRTYTKPEKASTDVPTRGEGGEEQRTKAD